MSAAYQPNLNVPTHAPCDGVEAVYRLYFNLLLYIAHQKFRVPHEDAENLIHEIFLSYLGNTEKIQNTRAWLIGSIYNASRQYWRTHRRSELLTPEIHERSSQRPGETAESVVVKISVRETLARMQERCRETLRLRYFEGCSAIEVAERLATTPRYAQRLIEKCLKRAHKMYVSFGLVQK